MQPLLRSTSDVLNLKDTVEDTRDTFSPSRLSESFSVVGSIQQQARQTKEQLTRWGGSEWLCVWVSVGYVWG